LPSCAFLSSSLSGINLGFVPKGGDRMRKAPTNLPASIAPGITAGVEKRKLNLSTRDALTI